MAEEKTFDDILYDEEFEDELLKKYFRDAPDVNSAVEKEAPVERGIVTESYMDDPRRLSPGTEAYIEPYSTEEVSDFADRLQSVVYEGLKNNEENKNKTDKQPRNFYGAS